MLKILFGADKKYMSYSHSATNALRSPQFSLYILPFEISNFKTIFSNVTSFILYSFHKNALKRSSNVNTIYIDVPLANVSLLS